MSYQSTTIATIINRLNTQYFLPAIQREFVWNTQQIIQLFDSIMRNYPISSFLFWELKPENREKWEVYKFVEDFHQSGTHNVRANTEGVQQLTLVLDGQQRLTSVLIGLRGSYTIKKKYMRWDNPDAWVKQKLYIDLLKDPKLEEDDVEIGVRYGFRFMDKAPKNDKEHYWIKVGKILDFDNEDNFYEYKNSEKGNLPDETTIKQLTIFDKNLDRLYRAIWREDFIAYYTETDQDYDRVLDIFVRANEGGTKLSKSDLLLSMITSKWSGINAREEIFNFVDRLNYDLSRKNNFDKDFIMKTCLVLCDLPVQYRVNNFSNKNLNLIESNWERIKNAIERGVRLINQFGIDRDTLTSANTLIPVLYYLFKHPDYSLLGTSQFDVRNSHRIQNWLASALINGIFSGTSDNLLRDVRKVLQDNQTNNFPAEKINDTAIASGRAAYFNDYTIENFLHIKYPERSTFLALSILYDEKNWGTTNFHIDHIFPSSFFTYSRLVINEGFYTEKWWKYQNLSDQIGNLQLLIADENLEKSNQNFEDWIKTRDHTYRKKHLIPSDESLYTLDSFEEFVFARGELINQRLKKLFPTAIETFESDNNS